MKQILNKAIGWIGILLIGSFAVLSLSSMKPTATNIEGKWKNTETSATVQIYKKGGLFFGKIIKFDNPEYEKKRGNKTPLILKNFKKKSETKYCCGKILPVKYNYQIPGEIKVINNNTLNVKGSYMGLSDSKTWKRVK